tara:strand:- start:358 stop:990 length:633 start_codon:yes stop_codon:yes gene_type:complete
MTNNYNTLAPFYQLISRLVFGKSLLNAQYCFLSKLKDANSILILGGGSGEFLPRLLEINPLAKIDYIEPSEKMIKLCKKNLSDFQLDLLQFHQTTFQDFSHQSNKYDAVLCFFFLDLFPESKTATIIQELYDQLHDSGRFFVADFHEPKSIKEQIAAKLMFSFLKISTNIENKQLYNLHPILNHSKLKLIEEKQFSKGFVFSSVWKKSAT